MKVLIDDIAEVVNKHWPSKDWYMEDCGEAWAEPCDGGLFTCDKKGIYTPINPGEQVELRDFDFSFGWQGKGEKNHKGVPATFETLFKRVQKAKSHTTMSFYVPKGSEEKVKAFVKKLGGKSL